MAAKGRHGVTVSLAKALIALVITGASARAVPTQWPEAVGGNGHYYEYVAHVGIPWTTANLAAQARTFLDLQGHLATLTSAAENAFLAQTFATVPYSQAWLGGWQEPGHSPADGWQWVTGEPWVYTNWCSGEPNDSGGDERFLAIWGSSASSYRWWKWNDDMEASDPSLTHGYFVEYPVPEPATLSLLALGAIAAVRRQWRK